MDLVPNTPEGGECEEAPGDPPYSPPPPPPPPDTRAEQQQQPASRYESQKRRDWNTFLQYLGSHRPPLSLARCSGAHVIEFLKYLDQFGKTRVHVAACGFFGRPAPPVPCACPLRQAWGSLDALIGRLRAAYEENGRGRRESNPFGARPVAIYLREVKESQAKARGVPYDKKRKRRCALPGAAAAGEGGSSGGRGAEPASVSAAAEAAAGELISSSSAAAAGALLSGTH